MFSGKLRTLQVKGVIADADKIGTGAADI